VRGHGPRRLSAGRDCRRVLAVVACALWLLAVEALPNLHLAAHANDHTHERDGSIVHAGEHRHGEVVHSHAKRAPKKQRTSQLAFDVVAFAHDADGLGHHAIAWTAPSTPAVAPIAIDTLTLPFEHACTPFADGLAIARPTARGPPVAS